MSSRYFNKFLICVKFMFLRNSLKRSSDASFQKKTTKNSQGHAINLVVPLSCKLKRENLAISNFLIVSTKCSHLMPIEPFVVTPRHHTLIKYQYTPNVKIIPFYDQYHDLQRNAFCHHIRKHLDYTD